MKAHKIEWLTIVDLTPHIEHRSEFVVGVYSRIDARIVLLPRFDRFEEIREMTFPVKRYFFD